MTTHTYWAVAEAFSNRVHRVAKGIDGAFVPTYVRRWSSGGKLSQREMPALYGYVLFPLTDHTWKQVGASDDVYRVILNDGAPSLVTDEELHRLRYAHTHGDWDDKGVLIEPVKRRRRRRPRPSKRARTAMVRMASP